MSCNHHRRCINNALLQAEAVCTQKGLRFTKLRRAVLRLIWADHQPSKAYDILERLDDTASASPPTVYRALDFLQQNGLVHKLNSLNAYVGCSHPLEHSECYFLICSDCGKVEECCSDALKRSIKKTVHGNDFKLKHAMLEVEGRCRECAGGA